MKRTLLLLVAAGLLSTLTGCGGSGGGGGGGTATVLGRIVNVETGGAPNPQATVQIGSATATTDASDGSFSITNAPTGVKTLTVTTNSTSGVWTFTVAAPTAGNVDDVGDLWVGPQRVTLTGQVLDSSNSNPVVGATVSFGGAIGATDGTGTFRLTPVAYPMTNFAAFWGIVGNVTSSTYFANTFTASPNVSVGGVVNVATILMTPLSNTTPPPAPYNIWGRITPTSEGANCTVTLSQNGTAIRQTLADSTGTYYFWVPPGTYTLHFVSGSHTDGSDPTVTVKTTNDVERQDVVLN